MGQTNENVDDDGLSVAHVVLLLVRPLVLADNERIDSDDDRKQEVAHPARVDTDDDDGVVVRT